ncbi:predicted protein [Nematostella vectensis]|uniref:BIG2 domain-containing protein n=1 Tax=Nematostella vectensis TaxID=45351 RepID=A7S9N9_NEMVE|nr:predicted protein [Nematostella vectensis]|eukprot:XP_001631703.1 predicted protein [Nematostella vectensis]
MVHVEASHQPTATLHVVGPAYLGFSIVSDSNWVLEVGKTYAVSIQLYTKDNHKIFMAENIEIKATFSSNFDVLWSSTNGSYHIIKAKSSGSTVINAAYTSIKIGGGCSMPSQVADEVVQFKVPISGQQVVEIFDPVVVIPEELVFPWHPQMEQRVLAVHQYHYQLKAAGGSGSYIWTSSNASIASVNTKGIIMTTTSIGHTQVKASDTKNMDHFGTMEVYVLPPSKMNFIPSAVEAEVGSRLSLPLVVAALAKRDSQDFHTFSDCKALPLTFSLSDSSIFQVIEDEADYEVAPGSCMSVRLLALRVGFTTLIVTYQYKSIVLKASITIGSYNPLKALDPSDVAVVTVGAVKNIMLSGGPLPWILDTSGYYEKVRAENPDIVEIGDGHTRDYFVETSGSYHFFTVLCQELGEQVLTVEVGNKPTAKNLYPATAQVNIRYACALPSSLTIIPDIRLPVVDGRQLTPENCVSSNKEIHVKNDQDLRLLLNVRDAKGRLFDNITSLFVTWSSSNSKLAAFTGPARSVQVMFIREKDTEDVRRSVSYQTIHLSDKIGAVTIKASVDGYDCDILRKCQTHVESPDKIILSGRLKLLLVPERTIDPPSASILNHPDNKVSPLNEGLLTTMVYDLCLDSPHPASVSIQMSDIYKVEVKVVNKIELGSTAPLKIQLLDMFDVPLLLGSFGFIQLTPQVNPNILNLRQDNSQNDDSPNKEVSYFIMHGIVLGTASLTFTATSITGRTATSEAKDVQVFPPLRLDPRVVTLLPGATFQVRATGGPTPQSTTSFNIGNQTVATVSSVGLVKAENLGVTNLTGMVLASDAEQGHTITYSKDVVMVHVVQLGGVRISSATTNLVTGTQVSLFATGWMDESPFAFANAVPGLVFNWKSNNPDVCHLKSTYHLSGISIENERDFHVELHCTNPGQTTVHLRLEVKDPLAGQVKTTAVLNDDVTFQVFQRLELVFPANGYLLLPHNVNTWIKTVRDGSARITYELITGCPQRLHPTAAPSILALDKSGRISTSTVSGTAVVLVTVHEEFGINQTAVVHVEVKAVSSLSITSQSAVRATSEKLHSFPLGMNALFVVVLHDNIGRKFHSTGIPLKHRLNRFDAVHILPGPENGTFYARAMNTGEAIFTVWDSSSPSVTDYIRIRVDHGLTPITATLLLGMAQQFQATVWAEGQVGKWSSSQPDIVTIDAKSGVALALSSGSTTLLYCIPNVFSAQTEVKVDSISHIRVNYDNKKILTNVPQKGDQGYIIPVLLGNHHHLSDRAAHKGLPEGVVLYESLGPLVQRSMTCSLRFSHDQGSVGASELFDAKPALYNGSPVCYIVPRHVTASVAAAASLLDSQLSLVVKICDKAHDSVVSSDAVTLPFVPAFRLSTLSLVLGGEGNVKKTVTVHGVRAQLNALLFDVHEKGILKITRIPSDDEQQAVYSISLDGLQDMFADVPVDFTSTLTGQKATVLISYKRSSAMPVPMITCPNPADPRCPDTDKFVGWKRLFFALLGETSAWFIGLSVIIGLIILLFILCFGDRSRRQPPPAPYGSPYIPSPYPGSPYDTTYGASYGGGTPYGTGSPAMDGSGNPRRHMMKTEVRHRVTKTASESDDIRGSPGSTSLGDFSPGYNRGLYSVTQ